MVHERTSSGSGLRPAAPPRPPVPAPDLAVLPPSTPEPGADAAVDAPVLAPVTAEPSVVAPLSEPPVPAAPPSEPPVPADSVPVEPGPLDPRAVARAALAAGRNASLWWVSAGIGVAVVVSLVVGTRAGSVVLAAVVAACGIVRWVAREPGPVALSVRARRIDVAVLFMLALGLGLLAAVLPDGWV